MHLGFRMCQDQVGDSCFSFLSKLLSRFSTSSSSPNQFYCLPTVSSDYYSQCQPGAAPAPTTTTTSAATAPSTLITSPSPAASQPSGSSTGGASPTTTSTPSNTGPGKTLQSGYYWIRAVAAPNFHKYVQTNPLYSTGPALLGDYTTAGKSVSQPSSQLVILYHEYLLSISIQYLLSSISLHLLLLQK